VSARCAGESPGEFGLGLKTPGANEMPNARRVSLPVFPFFAFLLSPFHTPAFLSFF
jgi:hypothetical protein